MKIQGYYLNVVFEIYIHYQYIEPIIMIFRSYDVSHARISIDLLYFPLVILTYLSNYAKKDSKASI